MSVVSCLSDPTVTFSQQSEIWLNALKTRKRKPVSPATLHAFDSYIRRLNSLIGDMKVAAINNGTLRQLVQKLDNELSPKTITELVAVVKSVVASLVDENTGEPILKREWSARFIDCPTITKQKQPSVTAEDIERCLKESASDWEKLLYSILAGTGLRIAEALAINVSGTEEQTSWDPNSAAIYVCSSIFNGRELLRVKTAAAKRTVDLDPRLNDLIARYVETNGIKAGDYLFQSRSVPGRPLHVNTARYWLAARGIPGFHSFRRFFISRRRSMGFPEPLLRSIVGHSGASMTDVYDKSTENEAFRKEWVAKSGLGFELPELSKSSEPASHQVSEALEPQAPAYIADDDSLDPWFFEAETAR